MNTGSEIRRARGEMGLSQGELAKKAQVKRQYISNIELGKRLPPIDLLNKIAGILDIKSGTLRKVYISDKLEMGINKLGLKDKKILYLMKELPHLSPPDKKKLLTAFRKIQSGKNK